MTTPAIRIAARWTFVAVASIGCLALLAAPARAETATLSLASSTIAAGGTTTATAEFTSTSDLPAVLTLNVTQSSGATGSVEFSNPVTSTNPPSPDAGGWNCAVAAGGPTTYECLWTGAAKDPGELAALTLTITASTDAAGTFQISAVDEALTPQTLAAADLQVTSGETTTTTTPTTTSLPASTTTTTTVPAARSGAVQSVQPLKFTG